MNIDTRPLNKGAKHTKYHVSLTQEVRHQLEGARVFTELDIGNGFLQVPLHITSHCVFQSHTGLHTHRKKRLFFGPINSTGIFHHKSMTASPSMTTSSSSAGTWRNITTTSGQA